MRAQSTLPPAQITFRIQAILGLKFQDPNFAPANDKIAIKTERRERI